jgi:hypothetical protein
MDGSMLGYLAVHAVAETKCVACLRQAKCGCRLGPQPEPPVALAARSGVDNTAAAAARRAALSPGGAQPALPL